MNFEVGLPPYCWDKFQAYCTAEGRNSEGPERASSAFAFLSVCMSVCMSAEKLQVTPFDPDSYFFENMIFRTIFQDLFSVFQNFDFDHLRSIRTIEKSQIVRLCVESKVGK